MDANCIGAIVLLRQPVSGTVLGAADRSGCQPLRGNKGGDFFQLLKAGYAVDTHRPWIAPQAPHEKPSTLRYPNH